MKRKLWIIPFFVMLLLCLVSCEKQQDDKQTNQEQSSSNNNINPSIEHNGNTATDYMRVEVTYNDATLENGTVEETVDKIYDSVVSIDSYLNHSLYGSGSGVMIAKNDSQSFIVTCHHVIAGCNAFKINLSNSTSVEAKLVGGDEESDIAVLAVQGTDYSYASWFKDTDSLRLGSAVICIGNPLGTLPGSVSTGVVSYNNRVITVDDYHQMKLIQTDVAINSGNSGGGLFNSAGALIGIVNAKYSSSGIEGLGFAIPAKQASAIVESILSTASYSPSTDTWKTGYVEGRWALEFSLGYGGSYFVRSTIGIASAATNPTASDYGKLQANDTIHSITIDFADDTKLDKSMTNINASTTTVEKVYHFIYDENLKIGDKLIFNITRNNQTMDVEVPLVQFIYSI